MRKSLFILLILLFSLITTSVFAQTALVKGHVINSTTQKPAAEIAVSFPYLKLLTTTNGEGEFSFSGVKQGVQVMVIGGSNTHADTLSVNVTGNLVELKDFVITPNDAATSAQSIQIPTLALEESDVSADDDGVKTQNVSGLLTASRDPFMSTAAFVLGQYRFQPRGYGRSSQQVLINGAPMNDIETGDAYWSQWGGLNDVFRNQNTTYGLNPSEYAFGGLNGTVNMDATAANQRQQTRVSYSATNRQYRNRIMLTKSSGLTSSGWAYSVSVSKRWADEGYIPGTFYDGYSYYASVSKRIKEKHTISLTTFGAPTRRGKAAPTYQEAYDLAGSNFYNPNWGYQNGVVRNAKVNTTFQPIFLLNYEYKPNEKTRWNTVFGYQFGKNKNSAIDWYNASDPRPDYYGRLPSAYITGANPSPVNSIYNGSTFVQQHQINWDEFYQENYLNKQAIPNANGTPSGKTGLRSVYVIGNDVDDIKKFTFNTTIQHTVNEHLSVNGGLSYISQQTESYKQLSDLLGGDFFLNINQFADRANPGDTGKTQYNANNPNQVLHVGDKYNYDYITRFNKGIAWAQAVLNYNRFDLFVSASGGFNSFSREGLFRNGLFPDGNSSFGKSATENFGIFGAKGGGTYKLDGRNYLFLSGGIVADAPEIDNTFYSVRVRNATIDNPQTQKSYTAEGGYLLHSPRVNARVVGYVTDTKNQTEVQRYYREDAGSGSDFVDYVLQNFSTRTIGTELALEYKLNSAFTATGVVSLNNAFYTSNPTKVTSHNENRDVDSVQTDQVFIKNYHLSTGPQSAYSLGLKYNSKHYWYANVNVSYMDNNYVDVAAPRRTASTVDLLTPGSAAWHDVVDQEKLPSAFTVDISGGKSILLSKYSKALPRGTFLYINAGISNLLNNTNIRTGGFENLRFDSDFPNKFATKYFYAYGRNFFVNVSLKF